MSLSGHIWEETSLKLTHWYKGWDCRCLIDIWVHFLLLTWTSQAPVAYWCWRCPCYDIRMIFSVFTCSITFGRRCKLRAPVPDNSVSNWHFSPLEYCVLIFDYFRLPWFFQFNGPLYFLHISMGATFIILIGGYLLLLDNRWLLLIFVRSLPREVDFVYWICRDKRSVKCFLTVLPKHNLLSIR